MERWLKMVILFWLTLATILVVREELKTEQPDENTLYRFKISVNQMYDCEVIKPNPSDQKTIYVSESMTWGELEAEGVVVDGEVNMNQGFWNNKIMKELKLIDVGPTGYFEYEVKLEAYY